MDIIRTVVVLDARDVDAESTFWAELLDGRVLTDDHFHCVIDATGQWRLGVQLAPDHVPPQWPHGSSQQVHLDLHVQDQQIACGRAVDLGATALSTTDDLNAPEGHHVYAAPAGHPFCIGWGHPIAEALAQFLNDNPD